MASFGTLLTDMGNNYNVDYNDSDLEVYNKLDSTRSEAEELKGKISDTGSNTGFLDLVGFYIGKAVDSLRLTFTSLGNSISMTEQAMEDIGMPSFFSTAVVTMLMIFLVLGVIVSAMMKKNV